MGESKRRKDHLKTVEQNVEETNKPQVLTNLTPQELAYFQALEQEKAELQIAVDFMVDSLRRRLGNVEARHRGAFLTIQKKYSLDGKHIVLNIETGEITLAPEPPAEG